MKKLIALFALVLFLGVVANAQSTTTTDAKDDKAKTEKVEKKDACAKDSKSGSCCSKGNGTASSGSCCKKGTASGTTEATPAKGKKAKGAKVAKTTAAVTPERK